MHHQEEEGESSHWMQTQRLTLLHSISDRICAVHPKEALLDGRHPATFKHQRSARACRMLPALPVRTKVVCDEKMRSPQLLVTWRLTSTTR